MLNGMVGVPPPTLQSPSCMRSARSARRHRGENNPNSNRISVSTSPEKSNAADVRIGANDSNAAIGSSQTVEKLLRKHHKRSAITPAGKAEAAARHFETHVTGRPELWHRSAQDD